MKNANSIFRFLLEAHGKGERTALVTLTDVTGGSARSPGTHLAVSEAGAFAGSFSGGCVEAAVIGEARRVIATGVAETIRFGAGSRFIDIRLPCGGGVDLLVTPTPEMDAVRRAVDRLEDRAAISLRLDLSGSIQVESDGTGTTGWDGEVFVAHHRPRLRIVIAGHGAEVGALTALALAHGAEVGVLSPDETIVDSLAHSGAQVDLLRWPDDTEALRTDRFTAVVLLFHDHDWELALLEKALRSPAFFVGAMGSRTTHDKRVEALRERHVTETELARLTGPIGLIPATRDPDTLALSVLAQIVEFQQRAAAT